MSEKYWEYSSDFYLFAIKEQHIESVEYFLYLGRVFLVNIGIDFDRSSTWKVTATTTQKFQAFINLFPGRVIMIFWSEEINT